MAKYRENVNKIAFLAGDSRYSHRTHATQNTYSIVDNQQGKVIAVYNTIQNGRKRDGNFDGPCNQMETQGLKKCLAQVSSLPIQKMYFAHDNDNSCCKTIDGVRNVNIQEQLDRNHAVKSISSRFDSFSKNDDVKGTASKKAVKSFMKKHGEGGDTLKKSDFTQLKERILSWFIYIVTCFTSIPQRLFLWRNAPDHWQGNHKYCVHADEIDAFTKGKAIQPVKESYWTWQPGIKHPQLHSHVKEFMAKQEDYVKNVSVQNTTQACESLNSQISRLAPKNLSLGSSYNPRIYAAIGIQNNPHFRSEMVKEIERNVYH